MRGIRLANVTSRPADRRRIAVLAACLAAVAAACPAARAQPQATLTPARAAFQNKAPLAWVDVDPATGRNVPCVMNMAESPDNSSGDWWLQPWVTTTFGQAVGDKPAWSTTLPNGVALARIQAFGGQGHPPADGTKTVDWADGSFLRISATAAGKYGLAAGAIFYSTRVNTANPGGYGFDYRIMVYLSTNGGGSWTMLPPPAVSGTAATHDDRAGGSPGGKPAAMVGLYSNFLFERSDGTIQVYYDDQATPWAAGHPYEQWLTMKELARTDKFAWGPAIVVDGNQPGRSAVAPPRSGMASVSERGIFPASTLVMTHEDNAYYPYRNPTTGAIERRYEVDVVTLRSTDGGHTWARVGTIQSPHGYHYLAPWHVRSKLTDRLYLIFRSDILRQTDAPGYDPYEAGQDVAIRGMSAARIRANLFVMTSGDDGTSWQSFYAGPDQLYMPGGPSLGNEPGVAEILLSPTSSQLVFQWGTFDRRPGLSIQAVKLGK